MVEIVHNSMADTVYLKETELSDPTMKILKDLLPINKFKCKSRTPEGHQRESSDYNILDSMVGEFCLLTRVRRKSDRWAQLVLVVYGQNASERRPTLWNEI